MEERKFVRLFLLIPSLLVLYFVYQIFKPFLMAIFLATILATLCYPVYAWILPKVKRKTNWAALLTCLGVTLVLIVPFILLIISLAGEANQVYQRFQTASENREIQAYVQELRDNPYLADLFAYADRFVALDSGELVSRATGAAQQLSVFLLRQSTTIVSSIAQLVTNFLLMLATMFFLFRDGGRLIDQFKSWTPLSESYEDLIMDTFKGVASATVLGSLLTAIAQGMAGGLVFWILGIPNFLLWGSLMALFSLVPLVGTAVVWVPWAVYLLVTGAYVRAIVLVLAAVLFVGMIDNVLRPMLIEGKAKMHTMLVFFSIMGGISYFGIVGMVIGPIMVALGLTFLELYKIEYQTELAGKKRKKT